MELTYPDPDFAFLFLKPGWLAARKRILRSPLATDSLSAAITKLNQTTISPALAAFEQGFAEGTVSHSLSSFDTAKTEVLEELAQLTGSALKKQVNTLHFYQEYLAVFPELFFQAVPTLHFSTALIEALRHPPLDLRWELYEHKPITAHELDDELFFYSLSQSYATALVDKLPTLFAEVPAPHDLALFRHLAAACAAGTVEILVYDV